ncbi:glycoside hydrolase family 127 protein [Occultella glacieicola]|uniref:Glycoside hydrolase family 127 protein n=1 Tax=Occultella glacieicola TaxID=2518684 RepID=A0ABY2E5F9_9MICO|nr:glycoside hydrolase family 127 protein [Occultella glacieicola]
MTTVDAQGVGGGPVQPRATTVLTPLGFADVRLTDGFLGRLQQENATTSIVRGQQHLDGQQAWTNFANAADGTAGRPYHGPVFEDGEAFKWLEATAWEHGRSDDEQLAGWLERYIELVASAQAPDGYLSTFNQIAGKRDRYEWISYDHEIFNMATMIQAAVARYRASGSPDLLEVARRAADHLDATFGFDKRRETCGHPLVEMALVELYRVTGQRRYLDLASYFVEVRGHGTLTDPTWQGWTSVYFSDRIPVRDTVYPEGHAVRAVYLAAGATDVAVETGDVDLFAAVRRQWDNMVEAKMYVNGSLGARWEGEAFGDPYELPSDRGYGETCAAIASIQWSWRLLLATGEAKYADLIERQLYNAVLSGVTLDGDRYFYVNTLQVREGAIPYDDRMGAAGRQEWFGCSCCPTNLMRTLASWHHYVATSTESGLQIHQYGTATVRGGGLQVRMVSDYPWRGDLEFIVDDAPGAEVELSLRVPGWAAGATLEVVGDPVPVAPGEYARVRRTWRAGDVVRLVLPMAPRATQGHHRVDAVRGSVAIERGPLVYAIEHVDQDAGLRVDDVALTSTDLSEEWRDDLFGGIPVVTAPARNLPDGDVGRVVAVPYFMWANREIGPMKVWLPMDA